jgi:hypothetical protein
VQRLAGVSWITAVAQFNLTFGPPVLCSQVHVFKLRKASNVNSLTNLVRVHSEWRASRPYLDPAEVEANLSKSRADRGPPSEVFRAANSWDKYREEDAPPPSVFSREANGRFLQAPSSSSSGSAPPLPPRSSSGVAPALGWTTFNNQAADPQPPPSSNNWSVNRQPSSGAPLQLGYGGGYDAPASTAAPADPFAMTPPSVGPGAIPITHMNSGVPGSLNGDGASPSLSRMSSGTIREQLARQYSNQYGDGPGTPGSGPASVSPYSTQQPPASRAAPPPPPMSVPVQNSLIDL